MKDNNLKDPDGPDNILKDEKSHENLLVYNISYKTLMGAKPMRIRFNKMDDVIEFMLELDIWYYLEVKTTIHFTTGLDLVRVISRNTYVITFVFYVIPCCNTY